MAGLTFIPHTGSRSVVRFDTVMRFKRPGQVPARRQSNLDQQRSDDPYLRVVGPGIVPLYSWIADALYWIHPAGEAGRSKFIIPKDLIS